MKRALTLPFVVLAIAASEGCKAGEELGSLGATDGRAPDVSTSTDLTTLVSFPP